MVNNPIELSIVIPALNEEKTIGICVEKALRTIKKLDKDLKAEVIVADNGSRDKTTQIAERLGARVVKIERKGYGNALMGGFKAAQGQYIIFADADDSYSFEEISPFLEKLKEGYDFVIGNRFKGKIEKGAMPPLHRYLGTPVLTWIMNVFFKTGIGDTNCGMRGLTKEAFEKMHLRSGGMEFATEMVVKASLLGLKIAEVTCNLYKDKRGHKPHLKTWEDGWRHLRFMLLFTTRWTFLIPGLILASIGFLGILIPSIRDIFRLNIIQFIDQKNMLVFMLVFLTGCQIVQLGIIAKAFSFSRRFDYKSRTIRFLNKYFKLEKGILFGLILILVSSLMLIYLPVSFFTSIFPKFSETIRLDLAIIAISLFTLGIQSIFSSFVLSLFYLKVK
jgi:glycosyltransferase involved in cell wall biosynthesis